jgi:BirA family biotin operon repressor/biotin-[acetyl-CoA-carboxylase] ligase
VAPRHHAMTRTGSGFDVPAPALRALFAAPLAADAIAEAAVAAGTRLDAEAVLQTGSTHADLLLRARQHAPAMPVLRAAVAQTAGRGRLGRRWAAAAGSSLLFSVAWPVASAAQAMGALTLAAGVGVVELLRAADVPAELKWPNDVLLGEAKLAGLLAELAVDGAGRRTLVIGMGLNLWADAAMCADVGSVPGTLGAVLPLEPLAAQREAWIGRLAAALLQATEQCLAQGFVPFQPRFMLRFAWIGREVDLLEQGARIGHGRVLGVDGEGRLLLDVAGRTRMVNAGEISVRPRAPMPLVQVMP